MGEKIKLALEVREIHGKKVAKLRADGIIPGVVYGQGFEPISVQADAKAMHKVYAMAGKHHPVHITIDGKDKIAMIKDADQEPVKRALRHVSFHAVKQNEKVTAEIPITLLGEGESAAERAGLVVLQTLEQVEVRAIPGDLPDQLEASILELTEAGDHVTIADLKLPSGVEFADAEQDVEQVIASVYEPSALQAANDAAGGDAEDEAEVQAENGSDTEQGGEEQTENPGGKKAKEDHGE